MSIKVKRIESLFIKEISIILSREVKDPMIAFVTITDCEVTNDLSFAKVYFTTLNEDNKENVENALNKASNFIELELAKRIQIRKMPQISFHYDHSIAYGEKIEKKIEEIHQKEE